MSYGRLAISTPAVDTDTIVYTVPANCRYAEITLNMLNPGINDATVQLALALTDIPAAGEYIEKGAILPANGGILERTGIVCSPGERIVVRSSQASNVVRVSGKLII